MTITNFACIVGEVVADPELRSTADTQRKYVNFQVVVDHQPPLYVTVRQFVWNGLPALKGGARVQITGELRYAGTFFIAAHTIAVIAERRQVPQTEEPNELNWSNYLDSGREPGLHTRRESAREREL